MFQKYGLSLLGLILLTAGIIGVASLLQQSEIQNSSLTAQVASTRYAPVGLLDGMAMPQGFAYGWAVDQDDVTKPLRVDFYVDAPVGNPANFAGSLTASDLSTDIPLSFPQYTGSHRFSFTIPARYRDGKTHAIYAYALDLTSGFITLPGSPKTFTLAAPAPTPTPGPIAPLTPPTNLSVSCPTPGTSATLSWSPAAGVSAYYLRVFDSTLYPNRIPGQAGNFVFYNDNVTATSQRFTATPGHSYIWWIHSRNPATGAPSTYVQSSVTCAVAAPTSTPTPTPTYIPTPTPVPGPVAPTTPAPTPKPATPTPTPVSTVWVSPIGSADIVNSTQIVGWACDMDSYAQSIGVHIYDGNPYISSSAKFITVVTANLNRTDLVTGKVCGSTPQHGFSLQLQNNPTVMAVIGDGQPHALYAIAINVGGGGNTVLPGGGKTVTLTNPSLVTSANNMQLRVSQSNGTIFLSWNTYPGALGYGVYMEGRLLDTTRTATSYSLPTAALIPGINYAFSVLPLTNLAAVPQDTTSSFALTSTASVARPVPQTPNTIGTSTVLAIIVNMDGGGNRASINSNETVPSVKAKLFTDGDSVKKFYQANSFGQFDITGDVVNVVIRYRQNFPVWTITGLFPSNSMPSNWRQAIDDATIAARQQVDLSKYNIITYVWPGTIDSYNPAGAALGVAYSGYGDPFGGVLSGRIVMNGNRPAREYAHEIGHVLGLHHGMALLDSTTCLTMTSCYAKGYGDIYNDMGNTGYYQFNGFDKKLLGWISGQQITQSGIYNIIGKAIPGTKASYVKLNDSGNEFYIDYHTDNGAFSGSPDNTGPKTTLTVALNNVPPNIQDWNTVPRSWVINSTMLMLTGIGSNPMGGDGSLYKDNVNKFSIIQIKHNTTSSTVYVRFDVSPTLTAQTGATGKVNLAWNAISPAPTGGYQIYRDDVLVTTVTTTSYIDQGLDAGSLHVYKVRGIDAFPNDPPRATIYPMSFSTTVLGRAGGATAPLTVCTHATPVALGTNGTFVAPCSGTMQLYVNDAISSFYDNLGVWHDNGYFDNSGIFTANFFLEQTVGGVVSDTPVGTTYRVNAALPTGPIGVPGPTLVAGKTYRYRASGTIVCGANGACTATADGNFSAWGGTCINSGSSCVVPAQFGSLVGVLNR